MIVMRWRERCVDRNIEKLVLKNRYTMISLPHLLYWQCINGKKILLQKMNWYKNIYSYRVLHDKI